MTVHVAINLVFVGFLILGILAIGLFIIADKIKKVVPNNLYQWLCFIAFVLAVGSIYGSIGALGGFNE